jgi:microcystin-dependent protein
MSQAYISQITAFGFNFAPKFWALCNGQILSIQQNAALFSLLGTTYGGNGVSTFALPNLQSRVMLHFGQSQSGSTYTQGEVGGAETVQITTATMPAHTHQFAGTTQNADRFNVTNNGWALATVNPASGDAGPYYAPDTNPTPLNPSALSLVGGNQSHTNIQPYLTINWCICMFGIFPSRN